MKNLTFWLLLLAAAFGFFYYQQNHRISHDELIHAESPHDRSSVSSFGGLAYLNFLRANAGLPTLAHSSVLEKSARNHARYLLQNPEDGHDERHRSNPFFTGNRPAERAQKVGYFYDGVHENISTGFYPYPEEVDTHLPVQQQIDGLMTAIYHRFSLLEQGIDEAGAAFEYRDGRTSVAINQGNHQFNYYCGLGRVYPEPGRRYYQNACNNHAIVYADEIKAQREFLYVVYPQGNFAMPDFHGEHPDPMPGYEFTGNPVSIAFAESAGKIRMKTFKLYQGKSEIEKVKVMTASNDPNHTFSDRQFALFPLSPLEYDTAYRAVFEYERNGKSKKAEWTFRTKKPDYPYFIVKGGEKLAIESGKKYFIHWKDFWCQRECEEYVYRQRGKAKLEVMERQIGGMVVRVTGDKGDDVRLTPKEENDKAVLLYIWQ
ncbi:CAP domain-containing protein [Neisseria sp. HMSC064E01]|uniref:CAP domain-containing protein n=1 Tax=Neisseria sp. HMSC064E01 TaxID=1715052 RepID=UPI0008A4A7E9|nr:CAP domain-containing protein [Neisseria sp. HMSC064E01]OFN77289.1 serine protease [Neisseria sp. HMSC064E01]